MAMEFPQRCWTCGRPLGYLLPEYLKIQERVNAERIERVGSDSVISNDIIMVDNITEYSNPLSQFLDEQGITDHCCRSKFLGYMPTISTFPNNGKTTEEMAEHLESSGVKFRQMELLTNTFY